MSVLRSLGLAFALATTAGCGQNGNTHAGRAGIVSLNPCTDAILAEVAAPGDIRALSAYSRDPNSSSMDVSTARRFGSTTGTVEEIAALRPALVISGNFTPPATRGALKRLGIPLVEIPIARTVEESLAQVGQISDLVGRPERGAVLSGQIQAALANARATDGAAVPALVWQSGGIVPGEQTLIADLLRRTGFSNAAAARGLGQADYLPIERVLAAPPKVIFATGDGSGEDRLLHHPALAKLGQSTTVTFPSKLLWCGGPTIIRAADRLANVRRQIVRAPVRWSAR